MSDFSSDPLTDSALPIVSAGEIRALRAALTDAAAGKTAVVMLDEFGIYDGRLNANQVRSDLVLGAQLCVVLQLLSGRRAVLLMGLPTSQPTEASRYSNYVALSNLVKSHVDGAAVTLERFASGMVGGEDISGQWTPLRDRLQQILRFGTALGLPRKSLATFSNDVFLVHRSTEDSAHFEAALTRTDSLLGDRVMCAGHLWWSDLPVEGGMLVENPLGGPGHVVPAYVDDATHLVSIPAKDVLSAATVDSPPLCVVEVSSSSGVDPLSAIDRSWKGRVIGLRLSGGRSQSASSAVLALNRADCPTFDPSDALMAAIAIGDLLEDQPL